jgi:putative transposase
MSKRAYEFEPKVTTIAIRTSATRTVWFVPRPPRVLVPNGIYHVTARGNRRQRIFVDSDDHVRFLRLFVAIANRRRWRCHGYCLMPNHYHLVIETPNADLSRGMQHLNGAYANAFNEQHGLDGHLFQGRFHAVLVESTWHLLELTRYLAVNPVAAGLCAHPADWPWGSYAGLIGAAPPSSLVAVDELLRCFGPDATRARQTLSAFVDDHPQLTLPATTGV